MNRKDYSKAVLEHALAAFTPETEREVEEVLQDEFTAFSRLIYMLRKTSFKVYDKAGHPATKKDLAAAVLYAAAALYEWEKSRPGMVSTDNLWKSTD
jgi:hypothetical protein